MSIKDIDNNEMQIVIQEFLEESRKYADVLNKDLLAIEELIENDKSLPEDLLNNIFRAAHTIKGTSSFLGFKNIFKLMHNMETILDEVRRGEREFEPHIIDAVFESFDRLETLLEKLEKEGNDEGDIEDILSKLKDLLGEREETEQEPEKAEEAEAKKEKKAPAVKKVQKQIVNETLGDEFLFSNIIMKTFDLLDEMDILKQKNNKNSVFEIFIKKDKIEKAIKNVKSFGDIIRCYKVNEGKDTAVKIEDETHVDKDTAGIYLVASSKKDIIDAKGTEDFTIREVYRYKESILYSMPPKEKERFLKEFLDSTESQMEEFSNAMIQLEEDTTNAEHINAGFRSMHTIKGSAGFIGMSSFEVTAHKIENIMAKVRDNEIKVTETLITLLLEGLDALNITLNAFKNDPNSPTNLLDMQNKLDAFLCGDAGDIVEEAGKDEDVEEYEAKSEGDVMAEFKLESLNDKEMSELKEYLSKMKNLYEIDYKIMKNTPLKSMKASLIETKLEKEGAIIRSTPTIDEVVDDKKETAFKVIYVTSNNIKTVNNQINIDCVSDISIDKVDTHSLLAPEEPEIKETVTEEVTAPVEPQTQQAADATTKPITTTTVRVDIDKLDSLMNLAGELVITKARFGQLVNIIKALIERNGIYSSYINDITSTLNDINKSAKGIFASSNDPILIKEYSKLDKLFHTADEQLGKMDIKSATREHLNKLLDLEENTLKLGKISSDLQNGIMQTRMVPVENVFSRFRRVVRDLSKNLKKDVQLDIRGEDTELDKKIIDELSDPLTHMIRNSLDHGVETREERLAAGKSETGTIRLSAYHKGNHICIEVSDDGKGIDADALVKSSVKKGLLPEKAIKELSEKEKLDLIFLPGFSMATKVTGVSGRGVGMDVVKNMIESINGSVEITTEPGKGTKFILNIPLTLAIIQALLVIISDEVYAIPLESVIEIIKIDVKDIYHIDGGETIKLRGHALSILDLRDTIKLKKLDVGEDTHRTVVVVSNGEEQLGIILDSLIGEQEIVIKSLSEHFTNVKGIVGASVLGDGTISLILDVQAIIKLAA
jgi:two-component system chemotaxis sensor kinase CheA